MKNAKALVLVALGLALMIYAASKVELADSFGFQGKGEPCVTDSWKCEQK